MAQQASSSSSSHELLKSRLYQHLQHLQRHLQSDIRKLSRMKRALSSSPQNNISESLVRALQEEEEEGEEESEENDLMDHSRSDGGESCSSDILSTCTIDTVSTLVSVSAVPAAVLKDEYADTDLLAQWIKEWESGRAQRTSRPRPLSRLDTILHGDDGIEESDRSGQHERVVDWIDTQLQDSLNKAWELSSSIADLIEEEEDGDVCVELSSLKRDLVAGEKEGSDWDAPIIRRRGSFAVNGVEVMAKTAADIDGWETWSMSTDDTDSSCMSIFDSLGIEDDDDDNCCDIGSENDEHDDLSDVLSMMSGDDDFIGDDDDDLDDDSRCNTNQRGRSSSSSRYRDFAKQVKGYVFAARRLVSLLNSRHTSPRLANMLSSLDIMVVGLTNSLRRTFRITSGWATQILNTDTGKEGVKQRDSVMANRISRMSRGKSPVGFLLPNHLGWKSSATFNTHASNKISSYQDRFLHDAEEMFSDEALYTSPSTTVPGHDNTRSYIHRLTAVWFNIFD